MVRLIEPTLEIDIQEDLDRFLAKYEKSIM